MKRSCKNINIEDWQTVRPWVEDCIHRHWRRYDFRKLLINYGCPVDLYKSAYKTHNFALLKDYVTAVAVGATEIIKSRDLSCLPPVIIREREDHTTCKKRFIGRESAMQQCLDFIAVYSCNDIWRRRLVPQQCSSIKGRGQVYGKNLIKHAVDKDNRAIRFAKAHNIRYTSKLLHHTKLDVKKCYPNADKEKFMKLFCRDCANKAILWLWGALLNTHKVIIEGTETLYTGFMIGALISQWAMQYLLSFRYRYLKNLHYSKGGKSYKTFTLCVLFMDDNLLCGTNRTQMLKAIKGFQAWAVETIGTIIKTDFNIEKFEDKPIDMMGYVIYRNGKVSNAWQELCA